MKAIRHRETKIVIRLYDDTHIVRITDVGLRSPERILDITPDVYEVVTAPEPKIFIPNAMSFDGSWNVANQELYDEIIAEQNAIEEEERKQEKREAIKAQYKTHPPVEVNGILWNGGDGSAAAINGAIQLAQANGEMDVTLWDAYNINHEAISFEQASNIAATIAIAYRERMFERNSKLAEI
jgi:hypothetical protein